MKKVTAAISTALIFCFSLQLPTIAIPGPHKEVRRSADVFYEMLEDDNTAIPAWLMRRSEAIAIITNLSQGGFFIGGRRGDGVIVSRYSNGVWSNPAFINLTGGSIGFQAGVKSSDLVLVFPSRRALQELLRDDVEFGGNISGTAGPVGRSAREPLEGFDDDRVYVYSRSKGLFGGVTLEGSDLSVDEDENQKFYGQPVTVRQILTQRSLSAPRIVDSLRQALRNAE